MLKRTDLHEYQEYCVEFIEKHKEAAIFLDMGLGKTIIALTAIQQLIQDSFEVRKALIIGPLRVAKDQWPAEIKKWEHLSDLSVSVAIGSERERRAALKRKADIYIINRENVPWLIDKSGVPFDYDMLVIDELSSFKNPKAQRFKALMKMRPRLKRVVGLTGSPAPNGLMDLFAEIKLIDMGQRLGRFITRFRTDFFRPDKTNGQIVYSYAPLPNAEEEIYKRIGDITISMKSADYLKMPEKIVSDYKVHMDNKEEGKYRELKKNLVAKLDDESEITATNAAALCGKLCQMANGAVYDDEGKVAAFHDRKLDALEDMIEAANGKPVLVVYWFRHDLERIKKRLFDKKIDYITMDKPGAIEKWNSGSVPVALISPASAGHGLNLQYGGSSIIWFGLTFNLEFYTQTNARLWRQGQKSNTVVINHIVTAGTIDEQILKALDSKNSLQEELINAVKVNLKNEVKR